MEAEVSSGTSSEQKKLKSHLNGEHVAPFTTHSSFGMRKENEECVVKERKSEERRPKFVVAIGNVQPPFRLLPREELHLAGSSSHDLYLGAHNAYPQHSKK